MEFASYNRYQGVEPVAPIEIMIRSVSVTGLWTTALQYHYQVRQVEQGSKSTHFSGPDPSTFIFK